MIKIIWSNLDFYANDKLKCFLCINAQTITSYKLEQIRHLHVLPVTWLHVVMCWFLAMSNSEIPHHSHVVRSAKRGWSDFASFMKKNVHFCQFSSWQFTAHWSCKWLRVMIQVRPHLEEKAGKKFDEYKATHYKSQVVAGTNFFIKVSLSLAGSS